MKKAIAVYGLTGDQTASITASLADGYFLQSPATVTDLLVADAICCIINTRTLDEQGADILQNYYADAADYVGEQIIWIGGTPLHKAFFCYDSFGEMLTDLDRVLHTAQQRYEIQSMYCGEYALLSARSVADSLEQDVHKLLCEKYGKIPDPIILKRMRQEWTALLEIDAVPELAAVYELTLWLKKNNHPYWIGGNAPSGFVPYLLGITRVNPLPTELGGQNLVWQEYASYGREPSYVFHLSADSQSQITAWLDTHWLKKFIGNRWADAQPYEDHLVRGNMHFLFDLDDEPNQAVEDIPSLCREDIFFYLKKHGFVDKDAFRGMSSVRKGRGFPVITDEMQMADDNLILKECENAQWLPSRAVLFEKMIFYKDYGF